MSLARHAKKRDANEAEIVEALERCGVHVWQLDRPCDLLTLRMGRWLPLEVKMPRAHPRKDQAAQNEFLALTHTPVVRCAEDALRAVGAIR
jgi:hypothetical protein